MYLATITNAYMRTKTPSPRRWPQPLLPRDQMLGGLPGSWTLLPAWTSHVSHLFPPLLPDFKGRPEETMNAMKTEFLCMLLLCGAVSTSPSQVGVRSRLCWGHSGTQRTSLEAQASGGNPAQHSDLSELRRCVAFLELFLKDLLE